MPMSNIRSELEKRAGSAIVQYAFFRWENAVLIALIILLMVFLPRPFPRWPIWGWPALGAVAVGVLMYSSITDAETNAKVLLDLFQEQFNPGRIRDPQLRDSVKQALEYQRRIEALVRKQRKGILRERLEDTAAQLADWVANIYQLAARLDAYRRDALLRQQLKSVPQELESLLGRRKFERDAEIGAQLDALIAGKRAQWQTLRTLQTKMEQAELQLEQSLTALATVYSQVQLINVQDIESGRSERLFEDIREQVARLNDLVGSLNEVYDYRGDV